VVCHLDSVVVLLDYNSFGFGSVFIFSLEKETMFQMQHRLDVKKILTASLIVLAVAISGCIGQEEPKAIGEVAFFTCPEDCPETLEILLEKAETRIDCELYYLSYSGYIEKIKGLALLKGNITIRLILEDNYENRETRDELDGLRNIDVRMMERYGIFHPKVCLIDDVIFIGSHNWSKNSVLNNREINVLIFNSENVIEEYLAIFESDWRDAT